MNQDLPKLSPGRRRPALAALLAAPAALAMLLSACAMPRLLPDPGRGWLLVSAQDHKTEWVAGQSQWRPHPGPDTVSLIDLHGDLPRVVATLNAPVDAGHATVSVAVSPNEAMALVTSSQRPIGQQRHTADNRLSVIDLRAKPPRVVKTVFVGQGPMGVAIHPQGKLALVANQAEGTVSVLRIDGLAVDVLGRLPLGAGNSGPTQVLISADGRQAFVSRANDHRISVLAINGETVRDTGRTMVAGNRPQAMVLCANTGLGVVANQGLDQGDQDTISLFDSRAQPPRVVDTVGVGQMPTGLACSADGRRVAVSLSAGSHRAKGSPFWRERGQVVLFAMEGQGLQRLGQIDVGAWPQGLWFTPDGRSLLVQNRLQHALSILQVSSSGLRDSGRQVLLPGAPVALHAAAP